MAGGADESGEEMVVGHTNESEERTLLVATNGENAPDGYGEDFVLKVTIANDKVLRTVAEGVDGIHATGTVEFNTGGAIGVMQPGNGVVGRGANGVVGYPQGIPRDKTEEGEVRAGVFGGGGAVGVFGRAANGVVGCANGTARDLAWESAGPTGVAGRGGIGVRGAGENGPGVRGQAPNNPGVQGLSVDAPGVLGHSDGGFGVLGDSVTGPGVFGASGADRGGMVRSEETARLWLVPQPVGPMFAPAPFSVNAIPITEERQTGPALPKDGKAGDLMAIEDPRGDCTLWFCVSGRGPAQWAQVLLGTSFDGRA